MKVKNIMVKKGSLSSLLLLALEKTVNGALFLEEFSYSGQIRTISGIATKPGNQALVMAIRRLRMRNIITSESNDDGKILLRLTALGHEFMDKKRISETPGHYTIVIWDIPENKRTIRNLLRRKLKTWGFVNCQKSVWVSRRSVSGQLRMLIEELVIDRWVVVIESDDKALAKFFVR